MLQRDLGNGTFASYDEDLPQWDGEGLSSFPRLQDKSDNTPHQDNSPNQDKSPKSDKSDIAPESDKDSTAGTSDPETNQTQTPQTPQTERSSETSIRYAEVLQNGPMLMIYDFEVTPYGITQDIGKSSKVLYPWHRVNAVVVPQVEQFGQSSTYYRI